MQKTTCIFNHVNVSQYIGLFFYVFCEIQVFGIRLEIYRLEICKSGMRLAIYRLERYRLERYRLGLHHAWKQ